MSERDLIELCRKNPDKTYDVLKASDELGISKRSIQKTISKMHRKGNKTIRILKLPTKGYLFTWMGINGQRSEERQ